MIEVFKTNIEEPEQAKKIISLLLHYFPGVKINIDLHDCDKVLRIEGCNFLTSQVILLVKESGFVCHLLE